jgi:vacuolar-type H+-ATPase subunit C/Vma6
MLNCLNHKQDKDSALILSGKIFLYYYAELINAKKKNKTKDRVIIMRETLSIG